MKLRLTAVLLGVCMLTACSAPTAEASSSEGAVSQTESAVSSGNISSENASSDDVISAESSGAVSSEKNVKPSKTVSGELTGNKLRKKMLDQYEDWRKEEPRIAKHFELKISPVENDPCITGSARLYKDKIGKLYNALFRTDEFKQCEQPIDGQKKKEFTKLVRAYKESCKFGDKEAVYYMGNFGGYDVCFSGHREGSYDSIGVVNNMAGRQFFVMLYSSEARNKMSDPDYYFPELALSGLFLIKDGKCSALEELYINREISDQTVEEIYNALPDYMRSEQEFEHYPEAYNLIPVAVNGRPEDGVGAITYVDHSGKFHYVVA